MTIHCSGKVIQTSTQVFSNNMCFMNHMPSAALSILSDEYRCQCLKLHSHMRGTDAERRRVDFDISTPPPRVCSHIRGADVGRSAISWGQRWFAARGLEVDAENWVLDPFVVEWILLPLRDPACVNACNDLCWSQLSVRLRSAHVWTYL